MKKNNYNNEIRNERPADWVEKAHKIYNLLSYKNECDIGSFLEILPWFIPDDSLEELRLNVVKTTLEIYQAQDFHMLRFGDTGIWYAKYSETCEDENLGELCSETLTELYEHMEEYFENYHGNCRANCRCCKDNKACYDYMLPYDEMPDEVVDYCFTLMDNDIDTIYRAVDITTECCPDGAWIGINSENSHELEWYEKIGEILIPYELLLILNEDAEIYDNVEYKLTDDGLMRQFIS